MAAVPDALESAVAALQPVFDAVSMTDPPDGGEEWRSRACGDGAAR
jgi:hypothetical protein